MSVITVESASTEQLINCIKNLNTIEQVEILEEELDLVYRLEPELIKACIDRHRKLTWSLYNE